MISSNFCTQDYPLAVHNLEVCHGRQIALQQVNFEITCHHRLALVGPNGAGKSTLIKAIAGLVKPARGTILWKGETLFKNNCELAYLPQIANHQQNFPATVREIIEMGRYPHVGMFRAFCKKDHDQVERAIELMKLEELENLQVDELSGGQQQRTFIARALAQEAQVVMMDEPFNGLDSQSRQDLAHTFEVLKENGRLVIASHHNLDNVELIFDKVLVLDCQQKDFGDATEVMNRYRKTKHYGAI